MEYIPPLGSVDPDASYVDVNKATGTPGSPVSAAAIEHTMREIVAVITAASLTPNSADLTQLLQAINALVGSENFLLKNNNLSDLEALPEALTNLGFSQSLGSRGRIMFPGGWQVQWDTIQLAATHTANTEIMVPVTFPLAFSTACYGVIPTVIEGWNTTGYTSYLADSLSTSGCNLKYVCGSGGGLVRETYLAWGK